MSHKVSLKDIAKRAGLSTATVSLALRNEGTTSSKTRERVQHIAKEMGYRPNPLLASLAARQFRSPESVGQLPLVFLSTEPRNASAETLYASTREIALEMGYSIDLIHPGSFSSAENLSRTLYNRGGGGIILGPMTGLDRLPALDWDLFSVVSCGPNSLIDRFHTVRASVFADTSKAWTRLQASGFQRIAPVVYSSENQRISDMCLGAMLACQYRSDLPVLPVLELNANDRSSLLDYVEMHRPDVVLMPDGRLWNTLKAEPVKSIGDLSFASLSVKPSEVGEIAGIRASDARIGKACIDLLSNLIRHGQKGVPATKQEILIQSDWSDGATLPAL